MKVSTKGRYALRLMVDLAQHNNRSYIPLKEISKRQGISIKYLEQITTQLSKAGYLSSTRGPKGGYRLKKKPEDYIVGDILRVTEGSLAPLQCLDGEADECPRKDQCTTLSFWQGLYDVILEYVDGKTVADLVTEISDNSFFVI